MRGFVYKAIAMVFLALQLFSRSALTADDYHTYKEMVDAMNTVESRHPSIAKVHVIGASEQNRDIIAVKISDNVEEDENEPEILFDAAIHGNESTTMEVAIHLVSHLTGNYLVDDIVTELVNEREIWVVPMVNPDGVEAGTRRNANTVDCNRDFGYMWAGSSGSTAPFSQRETRAMQALAEENQFVMATSFHSGNEIFIFAWSYTDEPTVDVQNYRALARGYSRLTDYPYHQSANDDYFIVGSSKDLYYGSFGALSWSIELSKERIPPYDQISSICKRNESGMLYLIWMCGQGITGVVTDSETGEALPAVIRITPIDWVAYADPELGDFHRFLVPGTYDVAIWANGYEPQIVEDIQVVFGEQSDVSVALFPMEAPLNFGYRFLYNTMRADEGASTITPDALGPPDGDFYAIGENGYVVIDMGPKGVIFDDQREDVTVYEADGTKEPFGLYASNDPFGPFRFLGDGIGTASFDLQGSGLTSARYFKIVDKGENTGDGELENRGYDLDAIGGIATDNSQDAGFSIVPPEIIATSGSYNCHFPRGQSKKMTLVDWFFKMVFI